MPYLIDGHNLIPKLGLHLDSPDDEMDLLTILQEYCRLSRHQAEIYFDGAPAGQARMQKFGRVIVHFVRAGLTADSAIASRLKKLGRTAHNWIVISSDHAVQSNAHFLHAKVISSEAFAGMLKRPRESSAAKVPEKKITSEELDEWLKLFDKKE